MHGVCLLIMSKPQGVAGVPLWEKDFFLMLGKKFLWPLSRGGGAKGLHGRATKKRTFFAASLRDGD